MAERKRSSDGTRDTDSFIEDMPDTPEQQDRSGGELARDVGTRDALKRTTKQGAPGVTRVRKSDEDDDGEES